MALVALVASCSASKAHEQQGETALAGLRLPGAFTHHLPAGSRGSCRDSATQLCRYANLPISDVVNQLLPLLGAQAHVDPESDCVHVIPRKFPCTIRGSLGPEAVVAVLAPQIVLPPPGRSAPPHALLVSPGTKFQDYYNGYRVTIELGGTD